MRCAGWPERLTFPPRWNDWLGRLTPYVAGPRFESLDPRRAGLFPPDGSLVVLVAWAAVPLLAAGYAITRWAA